MKELTAFFFGNDIPLTSAYLLYQACTPTTEAVRHMFYEWYFFWQTSQYVSSLTTYYNMLRKRMVYLSGSHYAKFEPIIPVLGVPAPELGIDNTSCPHVIMCLLKQVRKERV